MGVASHGKSQLCAIFCANQSTANGDIIYNMSSDVRRMPD